MIPDKPNSTVDRLIAGGLILAILVFYAWRVVGQLGTPPASLPMDADSNYYNLQIQGFNEGHLWMAVKPDPLLVAAANPYDPAQRPAGAIVLHDATFYKGHYYIYFGLTPLLTLFLPYYAITGKGLSLAYACLVFTSLGFLISAGLWFELRKRFFPRSGRLILSIGVLVLGLGTMGLSLLSRPLIWETVVASGYCFAMLTVAMAYRCCVTPRIGWFALAGASLGLAVGARPTYLFGIAILAVPIWREWRERKANRWAPVLAALVPLGVIGLGLAWYNYARFGSPTEFGINYALTGSNEHDQKHFGLGFVAYNARIYFFRAADWSRYFPFLTVTDLLPGRPAGYFGSELVLGILPNLPFFLFAAMVPAALIAWNRLGINRGLTIFLCGLALFYLGVNAIFLGFAGATSRYMVDFLPALALLAGTGALALEDRLPAGRSRAAFRWTAMALGGITLFACTMVSLNVYESLRNLNPRVYNRLAYLGNSFTYGVERILGLGGDRGGISMSLRLPEHRDGQIEPIVRSGSGGGNDVLHVQYLDGWRVKFRFSHGNLPAVWSEPIAVDYRVVHELTVRMGSMLPPELHPYYDSLSGPEIDSLIRWLEVRLDGSVVLSSYQNFFTGSPESVHVERESFHGEILSVRNVGTVPVDRSKDLETGDLEFALAFPNDRPGLRFPLLSTGKAHSGNILFVEIVKPGIARFGYDQFDAGAVFSDDVAVPTGDERRVLTVRMPSLSAFPPGPAMQKLPLVIGLEGRVAWAREVDTRAALGYELAIGRNAIEATTTFPEYPTAIGKVRRLTPQLLDSRRKTAQTGIVRVRVRLNPASVGQTDPLVVVGGVGRADFLVIRYEDENHVRFGLDHWGSPARWSEPVGVEGGKPQDLEIAMPTLQDQDRGSQAVVNGDVVVKLNGATIWTITSPLFVPLSWERGILTNPVGGMTAGPDFTGEVLEL